MWERRDHEMRRYVLALDQGTTSSRAIVFDDALQPCGAGRREVTQHFPQPGWVEHDPQELWSGQLAAARDALADAGIGGGEIAAVGITNQRETTIVWERATGRPVYPAIVWQCRRTADAVEHLRTTAHSQEVVDRTGLTLDAYFSGTKIAWILDNVAGARQAAERGDLCFGTVDSWLLWKLTNGAVHATDRTNASRTLLMDLDSGSWSPDLCRHLGVPVAMLPEIHPSLHRFGLVNDQHLGASLPVLGIAGDQQAALFGQACFEAGLTKNTYGTGCFVLQYTGVRRPRPRHGLLATAAAAADDTPAFAVEGSIFVAGAAVQWLRDGLGLLTKAEEIEALARSTPDSGGVVVVPAFAGLGAPHWDMYARGAILGLTRGSNRAHIARATLEAIALQTRDVVTAMEDVSGAPLAELRVDGGAAANDLLMEIQAGVLDRPVVRPRVTETTALGAAMLAGLGAGLWPDAGELRDRHQIDRRFEPAMASAERDRLVARWHRGVERVRGWADE